MSHTFSKTQDRHLILILQKRPSCSRLRLYMSCSRQHHLEAGKPRSKAPLTYLPSYLLYDTSCMRNGCFLVTFKRAQESCTYKKKVPVRSSHGSLSSERNPLSSSERMVLGFVCFTDSLRETQGRKYPGRWLSLQGLLEN